MLSDTEEKASKTKSMVSHYIPEEMSKEFVINYNQNPLTDGQIEQKIQYLIGHSWERWIEMPDV